MVTIIKTEFMKLKRYFIVWIGVSLMLLTVLLTLFTTMADDGMVWDYQFLFEQVVKHFVTMIFPMCITLISGYMISREYTDDTLKNIETLPISYQTQIDNRWVTDIAPHGAMNYKYTLVAYDESGNAKDVTFETSKVLTDGAYLCLKVAPIRGVVTWAEMQFDELPSSVQEKYKE